MSKHKPSSMTDEQAAEQRRRAAVSRMFPVGSVDARGRLLPLRYRVAEAREAAAAAAREVAS